MIEIILLSAVQGITEFLPISSSAHLIIISKYFDFDNSNITLDISLHLGSLLAIILFFRKEIVNFFFYRSLFKKILLTSIPISIVGLLIIKLDLTELLRDYKIIGWATILFGIILFISDLNKTNKSLKNNLNFIDAFIVGLIQIIALVPGVSRSGIVITCSRALGYSRTDSTKIAFLTSIPILTIITSYNIFDIYQKTNFHISLNNISGTIISFFFSYITIIFFLKYIKKFNFMLFVIYRVILGLIILLNEYY